MKSAVLVLVLMAAALPALAVGDWTGRLIFENDALWVEETDRHYTSGIQLELRGPDDHVWSWVEGPGRFLTGRDQDAVLRMGWAIGQNIYTPEDIKTSELVVDDRPYAGWLHADLMVTARRSRTRSEATFSLGVVGPTAQGEEVQRWFHELIDSPMPNGWDNQLADELALLLVVQRAWGDALPPRPAPLLGSLGLDWDFVPHGDLALGNVFTHAALGGVLRAGNDLDNSLGPTRIRPTAAGGRLADRRKGFGWSVLGGLTGRLVLHNIFLDGNTFKDSHSVDSNLLVGEAWYGLTLAWGGFRTSLVHTVRSTEFAGQRRPDHFGSITVTWTP